jgi:hypothetical protein
MGQQGYAAQGYPTQQQGYPPFGYEMPQQAPPEPPRPGPRRRKSNRKRNAILLTVGGIFVVIVIAAALGNKPAKPAASPATSSATVAASAPAIARKPSFPPKTLAAFRAFAATGDASRVHEVASAGEGLPSCPQPNRYVTVSPAVTGRALEADLSAYFVQNGLLSNQCGAVVFAYHSMSDYQVNKDNGFTAGRVILSNNNGSSPQFNLEVDTGSATNTLATFNFNF